MPHHYADQAQDGHLIHPPMTTPGPNALNVMTLGAMALAVGILEGFLGFSQESASARLIKRTSKEVICAGS